MKTTLKYLRHNKLALLSTILLVALEVLHQAQIIQISPPHLWLTRVLLIAIIGYVLVFDTSDHYKNFIGVSSILIPLLALASILLFIVDPVRADSLAYEDGIIENLSAIFLFAGSLLMLGASIMLIRLRNYLASVGALALALVFFVICMEEISWMQRAIGYETTGMLLEHNTQGEFNLHNINTSLTEKLYYFCAFLLLTVLPFYRHKAEKFLKQIRIKKVAPLLPSSWLFVPLSVIAGFVTFYTATNIVCVFIYTTTVILLFSLFVAQKSKPIILPAFALIVIFSGLTLFTYMDYSDVRHWSGSEYRELFIAIGLLVYATDLFIKSGLGPKQSKDYL